MSLVQPPQTCAPPPRASFDVQAGLLLQVQGDPIIRAYASEDVFIFSDVAMPQNMAKECMLPSGRLDFKWRFDLEQTLEGFPLDARTRNTKTLFIPRGTMVAGNTYYFNVEARVPNRPELSNVADAIVETKYTRLVIVIEYPKEVDVAQDFVINATASSDPDDPFPENPQLPFGPFTFAWDCAPWDEGRGNYFALKSCFVVSVPHRLPGRSSLCLPC